MAKFERIEALAHYNELKRMGAAGEHAFAERASASVAENRANWERLAAFQGLTFVHREGTWVLEDMTAQEKAAFQGEMIAGLKVRLLAVAQRGFSDSAVSPGNALASLMHADPATMNPAEVYGIADDVVKNLEENPALFENDEREVVDEVLARWLNAGPQALPALAAAYLKLFEEH